MTITPTGQVLGGGGGGGGGWPNGDGQFGGAFDYNSVAWDTQFLQPDGGGNYLLWDVNSAYNNGNPYTLGGNGSPGNNSGYAGGVAPGGPGGLGPSASGTGGTTSNAWTTFGNELGLPGSAGGGGSGGSPGGTGTQGSGGTPGSTGPTGATGPAGSTGPQGFAVTGYSQINWVNQGTINGPTTG